MKRNANLIFLIVLLALVSAAVFVSREKKPPAPAKPISTAPAVIGTDIGQTAPNFTLESIDGKTVSLSELRGQAVMLDFWAAWCPFCSAEFPVMEQAYQKYKDEGFVILGIHRSKTEDSCTHGKIHKNRYRPRNRSLHRILVFLDFRSS